MQLVSNQSQCDAAFRHWADTLTNNAKRVDEGWHIEGSGVYFTNYGHGQPGEITNQIMLGYDPDTGSSAVKIVTPKGLRGDKGPTTVLAVDDDGRSHLLREGRLQPNKISGFIKDHFEELTGLRPIRLTVDGVDSERRYYVVASLSSDPKTILAQTSTFANACMQARSHAGGGTSPAPDPVNDRKRPTYGADEKGSIVIYDITGGSKEVVRLQGYVYEEIKKIFGADLTKPGESGYFVDGMIEPANLLIEIKTGTSAQCIYEAVGQLFLYPRLTGIKTRPAQALVIPESPILNPKMSAAITNLGILIFTYSVKPGKNKPDIVLSKAFVERCLQNHSAR
ncbi:hypothetical protein [Methylobacterium sp. Leaf125]|uniref:hypothetical protein n=1 Tax=Methylobacterium sp. Leaf125 TaxID=1736265 RepID=UPI000B1AC6CA|nr:hypothetical protein [Methylobacterium sp. Leaf125]